MRFRNACLSVAAVFCGVLSGVAQAPAAAKPPFAAVPPHPLAPAPVAPVPSPPPPTASSILRPALDQVQRTLGAVRTDRWKRGSVREEAGADIGSIISDLQLNMPSLLRDADGAPGTLSKMLPVSKHVDALYDVLLRVVEASRIAAPDDQASVLRQALLTLNSARLSFDDSMIASATAQEKQIVELRSTVQKQAAFKCPAPPPEKPCPAPPVRHTRKHVAHKTEKKPETTQKPAPSTPQKPQ